MEGGGGKSPEDFENSFKKKKKHPQFSKQLCWTNDQQSDGGEKNTTEEPEITKFPDSGSKSNAAFWIPLSYFSFSVHQKKKKPSENTLLHSSDLLFYARSQTTTVHYKPPNPKAGNTRCRRGWRAVRPGELSLPDNPGVTPQQNNE